MQEMLKKTWAAWKAFGKKIGNYQARVLLTIFYAVLMLPFGLAARWFSDPLRIKEKAGRMARPPGRSLRHGMGAPAVTVWEGHDFRRAADLINDFGALAPVGMLNIA
jgi:hypothetical protein